MWHEVDGECLAHGVDLRALSYDRFLNVVYRALVARLRWDPEKPHDAVRARRELDRTFNVDDWRAPGLRATSLVRERLPVDAPPWWSGDEDASQTFLTAVGVRLRG